MRSLCLARLPELQNAHSARLTGPCPPSPCSTSPGSVPGLPACASSRTGAPMSSRSMPCWRTPATSSSAGRRGSDFQNLHRNKRAMTLNLKDERGLETFKRLAKKADVVVENFRPAVGRTSLIDKKPRSPGPSFVLADAGATAGLSDCWSFRPAKRFHPPRCR
jgi:hypothetical protein